MGENGGSGFRVTQRDLSSNGASGRSHLSIGGGLQRGIQVAQQEGTHLYGDSCHKSTNNNTHSQARAGKFRSNGGKYLQSVRSRLKCFQRGSARYSQKIKPTKDAILRAVVQVHPSPLEQKKDTPIFSAALHGRLSEEELAVNDALKSFLAGGSGIVDDRKPEDVFRLMGENINNFCLYDEARCLEKVMKIRQINQRFQTDMALFNELGLDLRQVPADKSLDQLLGDYDCRFLGANNTTEPSSRTQFGGVGALAYPRAASFILGSGKDPSGLGRWVWYLVGSGDRKTIICVCYRPVKPPKSVRLSFDRGRKTVWCQHVRLFKKHGLTGSPRQRFVWDITSQLLEWKKSGYEVVLFGDFNENVYNGEMAERLGQDDLLMTEAFRTSNGFETPASYFRGSSPLTGCFTTQGIDVVNVYVSAHQAGAGDHRYWIIDLSSQSVLGTSYPHLVRPRGRKLKCVVERTAKRYTKRLRQLCGRHLMFSKMEALHESVSKADNAVLRDGMNRWDRENVQHKYSAEGDCNTFKNHHLEFSPVVDIWIKRRDLYKQLKSINERRGSGKRPPISHFLRACEHYNISRPFSLSDEEIDGLIAHCKQRIIELEPVAPLLRKEHNSALLADAVARRQHKRIRRIKEIMRNEGERRKWGSIR